MDRFYTVAEDDKQRLRLALLMLYVLPGPPIIYYGTEIPLSQKHLLHEGGGLGFDEARLEMDWQNAALSDIPGYLRKLADIRSELALSTTFRWHLNFIDDAQQIMVLATQDENLLLFVNRSKENKTISLHFDKEIGEYQDVLTNVAHHLADHRLEITLPPISGLILSHG